MTTATADRLRDIGRDFRLACQRQDKEGRNNLTERERDLWARAESACIAAGICFSCWADGRRVKLGRWQAGNQEEYAGRECPECETFYRCGVQPEYEADEWMGDADPGL